ncbi:substrate-binding periplasmic protein [Kistimonas asteriae]|uniref:substrate-binding periplasmic protein n=1 Tax=Kistimonas asteriae TaxID=517724 RepID=UPI001BA8BF29|nr:transporter substrate-binding domain-containing protein [Kistimonas asteriae]
MRILALAFCFFISGVQAAQYHLVTENFPPLNMTNNGSEYARNQRVTGIATDIVRTLFDTMNLEYRVTLYPQWDRAFNQALDDENVGIYSTFRTPEREERFRWVGPLFDEEWIILAPADSDVSLESIHDLKNYRVGGYEADAISDYLKEKGVPLVTTRGDVLNAMNMRLGKIDLWATSSLSGPFIAERYNMDVKRLLTFNTSQLWLAMNKNANPELIKALNTELGSLKKNGQLKTILSQYKNE